MLLLEGTALRDTTVKLTTASTPTSLPFAVFVPHGGLLQCTDLSDSASWVSDCKNSKGNQWHAAMIRVVPVPQTFVRHLSGKASKPHGQTRSSATLQCCPGKVISGIQISIAPSSA